MKTHGICNAKSARKHRKMGHATLRLPNGRHVWTSIASSIDVPTENGLLVGYNRERARREGKRTDTPFITDKNPIGIIIDEEFPPNNAGTTNHKLGEYMPGMSEEGKKLLNEMERHKRKKWPLTAYDIEIGASYMPRKCNASSKPLGVTNISYNAHGAERIVFFKDKNGNAESLFIDDFLSLVSRRVWV